MAHDQTCYATRSLSFRKHTLSVASRDFGRPLKKGYIFLTFFNVILVHFRKFHFSSENLEKSKDYVRNFLFSFNFYFVAFSMESYVEMKAGGLDWSYL